MASCPGVVGTEGCQKALHIGVGAEPATTRSRNQGVDGTEPFRQWAQLLAELGDGLFVGDGDVEALAANGPETLQHLIKVFACAGQGQVAPVEPHAFEGGVLHHRRKRVAHWIAKQAHKAGVAVDHCQGRIAPPACLFGNHTSPVTGSAVEDEPIQITISGGGHRWARLSALTLAPRTAVFP